MDSASPIPRSTRLKTLVADFLKNRLTSKLEKMSDGDPKRAELLTLYAPEAWLEDAAKRAAQIQAVTHTLKAVHPDAKGTNCHSPPAGMAELAVVGSHCLGNRYELDVVGNAAALDVYKFLRLELDGKTLLTLAAQADPDLALALSSDASQAQAWMQAFAGLLQAKGKPSAHTLAKQLYWPVGDDAHDDASFHLLEPLYASSLAHKVYEQVQDDRFGEEAKAARDAKKAHEHHERPVRTYPHLAIQQLGGTKPQNISQLNSQRRGNNLLLASVPPQWASDSIKPLWNTPSMFLRFGRNPEARVIIRKLVKFLQTNPDPTMPTRDIRAADVDAVIDAFLAFTAELRELEPGWSAKPECQLPTHQAHWLDPLGAAQMDAQQGTPLPTDVLERVSEDFAYWFNQQLRGSLGNSLPVGDPEHHEWRSLMHDALKAFEREEEYV